MGDGDDRRVEARLDLTGRGLAATPERIADLQRQVAELDKRHPTPPVKTFDKVMAEKGAKAQAPAETVKQKKLKALPKRGPRPGLKHPSQRQTYGRADDTDDPVILKG
jgi:hypothetical protein